MKMKKKRKKSPPPLSYNFFTFSIFGHFFNFWSTLSAPARFPLPMILKIWSKFFSFTEFSKSRTSKVLTNVYKVTPLSCKNKMCQNTQEKWASSTLGYTIPLNLIFVKTFDLRKIKLMTPLKSMKILIKIIGSGNRPEFNHFCSFY